MSEIVFRQQLAALVQYSALLQEELVPYCFSSVLLRDCFGKGCAVQAPTLVVSGWSATHHLEEKRECWTRKRVLVLETAHCSAVAIPVIFLLWESS